MEQNKDTAKTNEKRGTGRLYAKKAWKIAEQVWAWIYRLRSVILAIPVVVISFILASENMSKLPALVGINLQSTGEYAMMIERNVAVFVPLIITAACLLMMFLSRRVIYPWLISLFSLVLPLVLWFTNVFPG